LTPVSRGMKLDSKILPNLRYDMCQEMSDQEQVRDKTLIRLLGDMLHYDKGAHGICMFSHSPFILPYIHLYTLFGPHHRYLRDCLYDTDLIGSAHVFKSALLLIEEGIDSNEVLPSFPVSLRALYHQRSWNCCPHDLGRSFSCVCLFLIDFFSLPFSHPFLSSLIWTTLPHSQHLSYLLCRSRFG
jgi:hypothetical protein